MSIDQASYFLTDSIVYINDIRFKTTANLNYSLNSQSSGIADINYAMVNFQEPINSITKHESMYKVENEGQERYVGDYYIAKNIQMSSNYERMLSRGNWIYSLPHNF
ncbi:MAG: hypothetical protein MUO26_00015 [Methanotrichaceae archaeon]|nr:hypothetical protein [Methanotrichaceae archaeon]